ncbi:MAG: PP2C family protein-serine/threonine phosphatase [Acidobacteria bacterium]|nr:PP2C family protein-serine/threonine phosphatase [Acidobacteriota bacterium]
MKTREPILWLAAGVVGILLLLWAFPRVYELAPKPWTVDRAQAERVALARLAELAPIDPRATVVLRLDGDAKLERRLEESLSRGTVDPAALADTSLSRQVLTWNVTVYPPGATPSQWSHRAVLDLAGKVLSLERAVPADETAEEVDSTHLWPVADRVLEDRGYVLSRFEAPEQRSQEEQGRTEWTFTYRAKDQPLGPGFEQGMKVRLAGDRLVGYGPWYEDRQVQPIQSELQRLTLVHLFGALVVYAFLLLIGAFFMRRYHAGEIGVRAGLQIFSLSAGLGLLGLTMIALPATENLDFGLFSRRQVAWVWGAQFFIFQILAIALVTFLAWSVGESFCRERWGHKLAAFDALRRGRWANATVARSAWRGLLAGVLLGGVLLAVVALGRPAGLWMLLTGTVEAFASAPSFAVAQTALTIGAVLYTELVARLFLLPPLVRRFGAWRGGLLVVAVETLCVGGALVVAPVSWSFALNTITSAALVALFLRYDLVTSLLASLVVRLLPCCLLFLASANLGVQLEGAIPLLLAALPALVGLRYLAGGAEVTYRYDDVPPHVRRIAERERQRIELETARGIQSSILPDLPSSLAGVEIAHAYRPATEVGGDFYDVLALDDGRLAVAVGDVAGHGVSSGLIMSMAKSALAVQVTFDPQVPSVFSTLNRMIYQSARRRLLATLCYALVDPPARQVLYASAGHLFPYRVSPSRVEPLESVAYPLGVRPQLAVEARSVELDPGDFLFLFSDGLVEAQLERGDEVFGFERLERSLLSHAGRSAAGLRDGVLADVALFTAGAPPSDDQTVLVLRMP